MKRKPFSVGVFRTNNAAYMFSHNLDLEKKENTKTVIIMAALNTKSIDCTPRLDMAAALRVIKRRMSMLGNTATKKS